MMRNDSNRIMPDRLVQTRIPDELVWRIQDLAAEEGESIASWLRRLVFRELRHDLIEAWLEPRSRARWADGLSDRRPADFQLRLLAALSASEREFVVHDSKGRPRTPTQLRDWPGLRRLADHLVVLRGSVTLWEPAAQLSVGPEVRITLRALPRG